MARPLPPPPPHGEGRPSGMRGEPAWSFRAGRPLDRGARAGGTSTTARCAPAASRSRWRRRLSGGARPGPPCAPASDPLGAQRRRRGSMKAGRGAGSPSFNRAAAGSRLMGAHRMLPPMPHELRTRCRIPPASSLQQTHDPKYQAALESDVAELDLMIGNPAHQPARRGRSRSLRRASMLASRRRRARATHAWSKAKPDGLASAVCSRAHRTWLDNASHHGTPPLRVVAATR